MPLFCTTPRLAKKLLKPEEGVVLMEVKRSSVLFQVVIDTGLDISLEELEVCTNIQFIGLLPAKLRIAEAQHGSAGMIEVSRGSEIRISLSRCERRKALRSGRTIRCAQLKAVDNLRNVNELFLVQVPSDANRPERCEVLVGTKE